MPQRLTSKEGVNDKRCLLEAVLDNMEPIVVKNHANTYEQAVEGALDKLMSSLHTSLDRLKGHQARK